jgi:hypothetical protein
MKIPAFLIPVFVIIALFSGYFLRNAFTQPTTNISFQHSSGSAKLECVVDGVKCKGTANFFTKLYNNVPGVANIETFATEHKAIFTYDPAVISPDRIKEIMEAPIPLRDGTSRQVFQLVSMEKM